MRFYVCLMFHYTDIFLFPDIHPCLVSFSPFYHISFCMYVQIFVRKTSTLRKFSYEAKKNIGLHEAYDIIKIFCSVGEKRQEGYIKKNLIHLPKAQNDFIKAINLKPHMRWRPFGL